MSQQFCSRLYSCNHWLGNESAYLGEANNGENYFPNNWMPDDVDACMNAIAILFPVSTEEAATESLTWID